MSGDLALQLGDRGLRSYALAFMVTQLIEVPIYVAALRASADPPRRRLPERAAIAFGASLLTHPIVWYMIPPVVAALLGVLSQRGVTLEPHQRVLVYGALAEGFAVAAEALYLRRFGVKRALLWAFGANAASVLGGVVAVWLMG